MTVQSKLFAEALTAMHGSRQPDPFLCDNKVHSCIVVHRLSISAFSPRLYVNAILGLICFQGASSGSTRAIGKSRDTTTRAG